MEPSRIPQRAEPSELVPALSDAPPPNGSPGLVARRTVATSGFGRARQVVTEWVFSKLSGALIVLVGAVFLHERDLAVLHAKLDALTQLVEVHASAINQRIDDLIATRGKP